MDGTLNEIYSRPKGRGIKPKGLTPCDSNMKKLLGWILVIILLPISYLLFINIESIDVNDYKHLNQFDEQRKARNTEVSFAIINTGTVTTSEAFVVKGGSLFQPYTISHTAIFIKHPKGNILFDTGLGADIDEQFELGIPSKYKFLLAYEKLDNAKFQLEQHGIPEDSIAMIIPSHLHWDHASGLEAFMNTDIFIPNSEKDWAFSELDSSEFNGCIASQFDDERLKWKTFDFDNKPYENFPQSLDVYGDGSIILLPIPGHSPGSLALLLTTKYGDRYLFTGDLTWSLKGLQIPAEKFSLSSDIVDNNPELLKESIARVYFLKKRYPELHLVPAHDYKVHKKLGFFPEFIR